MSKSDLQVNNFGFIIRLMDCRSLLISSINRVIRGRLYKLNNMKIIYWIKNIAPKIYLGSLEEKARPKGDHGGGLQAIRKWGKVSTPAQFGPSGGHGTKPISSWPCDAHEGKKPNPVGWSEGSNGSLTA